jgi:hypothetical protein
MVVNAGKAQLEVIKDGYVPLKRAIELPGAGTLSFEAALVPQQTAGILVVNVTPKDGVVYVDGRAVGAPPVEVAVEAGTHAVRVAADGYGDLETRAVVESQGRKEVSLELRKKTVLETWWFWTTVGVVVVAGGVAIGVALTTEREAGTGDIAPGRVRGPLISF